MIDVTSGFDAAARKYDLMVALNPGYRAHLRRAAEALLDQLDAAEPVLFDLGCGSGLSTRELLEAAGRRGLRPRIIGVDASGGMLDQARARAWPDGVEFHQSRAEDLRELCAELELPLADGVLACYLLRNVGDLDGTLRAIREVSRPGAPLVAEDYSVRGSAAAARRWGLVNRRIIIPLARVIDGDAALYEYLHRTVDDFATMPELAGAMEQAGWVDIAWRTVPGWQRDILHLIRARTPRPDLPPVEHSCGAWRIRAAKPAREVLRARHQTTQAGFTAEFIPKGKLEHRPILISDGPIHDEQRRKVARFFAPTVVAAEYTALMDQALQRWVGPIAPGEVVAVDELALHFAVDVTARIVGLDASEVIAMSRRLESFFRQPPFDITRPDLGRTPSQWARAAWHGLVPVGRFWWSDVRPAVRARRSEPRGDIISHLIAEGYSDIDILIESVTYGTAGMVTTREFMAMSLWQLLRDADLRQRYEASALDERLAILEDLIRRDPVVGNLYRRIQQPFADFAEGDLVDIDVRCANGDEDSGAGLSFGDGAHRCPGQPLALHETDVLLRALLARKPRVVREPEIGWVDLVAGYTVREFLIELG